MIKGRVLISEYTYSILLLSLLVLLFGHLLIPEHLEAIFTPVFLLQNVVVSLYLLRNYKPWRYALIFLLVLLIVSSCFAQLNLKGVEVFTGFAYIIYFILLSFNVYKMIYNSSIVGREMIAAVFCGFIMLSTIGSFMFLSVELFAADSFSNLGEGVMKYYDLRYFSFITTLTIGYGDIVPQTTLSKNLTILLGLAGNFYSVIVTGIVLGKFVNEKRTIK